MAQIVRGEQTSTLVSYVSLILIGNTQANPQGQHTQSQAHTHTHASTRAHTNTLTHKSTLIFTERLTSGQNIHSRSKPVLEDSVFRELVTGTTLHPLVPVGLTPHSEEVASP
ncbi:hypothetical protein DPMN_079437 [Dreissena polymorpha]|uniref:Uncharacterized protein n=1 Tax=Dreissena polymorpha TaxID=45954 RepID=A0A9D3YSJ1_DREPO|nr:hypothetical protein DPMN_079421 [Dreissena polymorpha]KAH3704382.1 hypothetical protein DPMN_079437 [Dreissena polymorpha]